MTKNLEKNKVKAFLKTLKEQYPEQFDAAVEEFTVESKGLISEENKEGSGELDNLIRKNFDRYADVFKALA
jgi:hypothetical protein